MVKNLLCIFGLIAMLCVASSVSAGSWTDPYDVIWDTPGTDAAGSMPMGNGEVGINLWVEENGDLNFYISRSDSFSEISRLLKVGQVRVAISPNPFVTGAKFEQRLHLHDGVCEISAGEGGKKVTLQVFVDAILPVVNVIGESASPVTVTASIVSWRTAVRPLPRAEINSAWAMNKGATFPLIESADLFPQTAEGTAAWYHRNETTVVPATLKVQSLESVAVNDPLLHRTFGGIVSGDGFKSVEGHAIQTPTPVTNFAVRVATPAGQFENANEWIDQAKKVSAESSDSKKELDQTTAWWNQFWDRSWVQTDAGRGITVPANRFPLRIGVDSDGNNKFPGELTGTTVINRAMSADEAEHLTQNREPAKAPDHAADFTHDFTLDAYLKPTSAAAGRIFDKMTAGGSDGFIFDTQPNSTLRLIVGNFTLTTPPGLMTPNEWHHAAATVNASTGETAIYLDGKQIADHGGDTISPIARGYTLQRYVQACGGRGNYPIKFNGGIFTVEPKLMGKPFNADYRNWGDCFWWQNTRHMYHPMLVSGDIEMMDPLFKMYSDARPLCEARAKLYHQCGGCYFPETMTIWGTYANGDYGWNRKGHQPQDVLCPYWQYAWNQGPELVSLMLDRWDYTNDSAFLKQQVLPMAQSVLAYFDTRFKRDDQGKIILDPTQSVETFWSGVINDMPSVAGLNDIATRLCDLPADLVTPDQKAFFEKMKAACPSVPIEDGRLAPAQKYVNRRSNIENPELYAIWPFRLFGIGKPGLDEAIAAYDHRANHLDTGWGYDGNCAALLGLTDESARILKIKCANSHKGYRWPATWGPNYDWLPDQNHGGNLLETADLMLLQCDGQKIRLMPAWPKQWDVSFKLHATGNTVVECVYQAGKIEKLEVTPASRRSDIVLPPN